MFNGKIPDNLGQISYSNRTKLLYVLALLLIILLYHFAVKPTLTKYRTLHDKKEQLAEVAYLPIRIKMIKRGIKQINEIIGETKQDTTLGKRRKLLEAISNYCDRKPVTINNILKPEYIQQNNVMVELNQVLLKGRFAGLLRFVYYMEGHQTLGHIASLSFILKKDVMTKKKSLNLKVYFQTVNENKTITPQANN